ncbi:DoxX family protein [Nocardia sp. NEAU-G5]|uniref:DoxX family protein n=1 Tax=Nocardia albiluteola TaxID=2842303 RepID=A0ABS6BC48_9NOCA|nr:DoxX family protein [Nocardia albiluteola]MBU3066985.1 DoxX family protein [Nocardia albiluteola]
MTATAHPAQITVAPGKVRNRILWTVQILLGVFFIVASGLPKLVGEATAVHVFQQIGLGQWLRYLAGLAEVSGGIGLLIPRLTAAAATGLAVTTVLAACTQAFLLHAPAMAIFPLVLAAIFATIAWQRRASFSLTFR